MTEPINTHRRSTTMKKIISTTALTLIATITLAGPAHAGTKPTVVERSETVTFGSPTCKGVSVYRVKSSGKATKTVTRIRFCRPPHINLGARG